VTIFEIARKGIERVTTEFWLKASKELSKKTDIYVEIEYPRENGEKIKHKDGDYVFGPWVKLVDPGGFGIRDILITAPMLQGNNWVEWTPDMSVETCFEVSPNE
jgi:hypothetical protein